jgi:hypothetical protein
MVSDFDGDGTLDLVGTTTTAVAVFWNTAGSYNTATNVSIGSRSIVADVNNDGSSDVVSRVGLVGVRAVLSNRSRSSFRNISVSSSPAVGMFLVDVNNDSMLDVPAANYVSSGSSPPSVRVAWVRVLSRGGVRTCIGATLRVVDVTSGVVVATRFVGAAGVPYDAHVAVSGLGPFALNVSFPSGRVHSAATQPQRLAPMLWSWSPPPSPQPLLFVRDVPAVAALLRVSFVSVVVGIGGAVNVTVVALNSEAGLAASPACTVNNANVTASMVDGGNGTYTFTYVAALTHGSVAANELLARVSLVDRRANVTSDEFLLIVPGVVVDTVPPRVSFNATADCSPDNNTVTATVNQTLCVSCGSLSAEPRGCAVFVRLNATAPVLQLAADATNTARLSVGPLRHDATPRVEAWAVDAAGNVGPAAVLLWEVDTSAPVTTWTPFAPRTFSNSSELFVSLGCSLEVRWRACCPAPSCCFVSLL